MLPQRKCIFDPWWKLRLNNVIPSSIDLWLCSTGFSSVSWGCTVFTWWRLQNQLKFIAKYDIAKGNIYVLRNEIMTLKIWILKTVPLFFIWKIQGIDVYYFCHLVVMSICLIWKYVHFWEWKPTNFECCVWKLFDPIDTFGSHDWMVA
jgi:hypothetical protein